MNQEALEANYFVVTKKYGEFASYLDTHSQNEQIAHPEKFAIPKIPDEVIAISQEIRSLGGQALMVGGSVRDFFLSQYHPEYIFKPKDFDLEIYGLDINTLQRILEKNFGADKVDSVGKAFGVIKVKIKGWDEPLDFSVPRTDNKSGQGHRGFSVKSHPEMSILEAARRRDLTINSMAYDPLTGTVYDPFGGLNDLRDGIIKATDSATFIEDPLRVLRVAQFASRFGFSVDKNTVDLCRQMVSAGEMTIVSTNNSEVSEQFEVIDGDPRHLLPGRDILISAKESFSVRSVIRKTLETPKGLPSERVTEEIYKLLIKGTRPSLGFEFMRQIGLIDQYWPMLSPLIGLKQEYEWHKEGDVWTHTMEAIDAAAEIADREIASGRLPTKKALAEIQQHVDRFKKESYEKKFHQILIKRASLADPTINQKLTQIEIDAVSAMENEKQIILGKMITKVRAESPNKAELIIEKNLKGWIKKAEVRASGVKDIYRQDGLNKLIRSLINSNIFTAGEIDLIKFQAAEYAEVAGQTEQSEKIATAKKDARAVIILAALCHDFGKVTTTDMVDGLIRSFGHDVAGVSPTRAFLKVLYNTRFSPSLKRQIFPLVAEHMRPKEYFDQYADSPSEIQILTRLARKLAFGDSDNYSDGGGADLFLLSLVAEADQRGRKPGGTPYTRDELGKKLAWQSWIWKRMDSLKLDQQSERLIDGDEVLTALEMKSKDNGPWVGVIIRCLELDIQDGRLTQQSEFVKAAAKHYFQSLNIKMSAHSLPERRVLCLRLLKEDPREFIFAN